MDIQEGQAHNTLCVDGETVNAAKYARNLAEQIAYLSETNSSLRRKIRTHRLEASKIIAAASTIHNTRKEI